MLEAKVSIKGLRPMLWHHFGLDAIPVEPRERTGVAGNDPEEWRRTYLATKDGQLYIEPTYIFACLREAARYTKKGVSSIQKQVAATLQLLDDLILVDRWIPAEPTYEHDKPVYVDIRSVVNPKTKGRNIRYRVACSAGWTTTFHIVWDETVVSRSQMEAIIIDAGTLVGLGDGRGIGFGRFILLEFEVERYAEKETS